jgi:hypothetical protein
VRYNSADSGECADRAEKRNKHPTSHHRSTT